MKTKVLHVRKHHVRRTTYQFKFDDKEVELCSSYKYLGLVINDTLNFQAKYVRKHVLFSESSAQ